MTETVVDPNGREWEIVEEHVEADELTIERGVFRDSITRMHLAKDGTGWTYD